MCIGQDGEEMRQKNEGRWDFTLQESQNSSAVELDVAVGKYLDSSLIKADVQPSFVRLLIKVCCNAAVVLWADHHHKAPASHTQQSFVLPCHA